MVRVSVYTLRNDTHCPGLAVRPWYCHSQRTLLLIANGARASYQAECRHSTTMLPRCPLLRRV